MTEAEAEAVAVAEAEAGGVMLEDAALEPLLAPLGLRPVCLVVGIARSRDHVEEPAWESDTQPCRHHAQLARPAK